MSPDRKDCTMKHANACERSLAMLDSVGPSVVVVLLLVVLLLLVVQLVVVVAAAEQPVVIRMKAAEEV